MHSSTVSKIEKSRAYAEEKERVTFSSLSVCFRGNHNSYDVSYDNGDWSCACRFFASHALCSHTMALQRILEGMLPREGKAPILERSA